MALVDRNIITGASGTSGIRDATLFWDASPSDDSRLYIGKTQGQGRISPDIVINSNGNVGIGTDTPSEQLTVEGPTASRSDPLSRIKDTRASSGFFASNTIFTVEGPDASMLFGDFLGTSGSSVSRAEINVPNDRGFGIYLLTGPFQIQNRVITALPGGGINLGSLNSTFFPFTANAIDIGSSTRAWDDVFADNFINISDKRAKDDIKDLSYGLAHLMKLKPVSYIMKDNPEKGIKHGLIAQDVQEVIPEVVYDPKKEIEYDEDGQVLAVDSEARMGIDYTELVPLLIKSVQELNEKVLKQEKIIADLTGGDRDKAKVGESSVGTTTQEMSAELYQNYPNPFDQSTAIQYYLPENIQQAQLYLYDVNGLQVKTMEINQRGKGEVNIQGNELKAGIYFYTLFADGQVSKTMKMILTD